MTNATVRRPVHPALPLSDEGDNGDFEFACQCLQTAAHLAYLLDPMLGPSLGPHQLQVVNEDEAERPIFALVKAPRLGPDVEHTDVA